MPATILRARQAERGCTVAMFDLAIESAKRATGRKGRAVR